MSIEGFGGWMLGKVRMFFFLTTNKRVETRRVLWVFTNTTR